MDKKKKYILIAIFCVIGLLLGSTVAWFAWRSSDNTSVTIRTGGVKVTYEASPDITGRILRPVSTKEYGVANDYAIEKEITISASKKIYFSLYLNIDIFEDINHESLKWELYEGDNQISSGNFKYVEQGDRITLLTNYGIKEEKRLTLYIWIDGENYDNPFEMQSKDYKFVLNAEAIGNETDHGLYYYDVSDTTPGVLVGSGTETDPYLIESIEDLIFFSNDVNNGNTYEGEYVHLKQSLNFNYDKSYVNSTNTEMFSDYNGDGSVSSIKEEVTSGQGFTPIGIANAINGKILDDAKYFSGNFFGNGNSIMNLHINYNSNSSYKTTYIGLFGYIKNATLKKISVSGSVQGEAVGEDMRIAGVVGAANYGNISGLVNYAELKGFDSNRIITHNYKSSDIIVGGVCSFVGPSNISPGKEIIVEDNVNYGNLFISGEERAGYNVDSFAVGGVIGTNSNGIMKRNINHGKITVDITTKASRVAVGGCVAVAADKIYECVNSENGVISVNVENDSITVGGISGSVQEDNDAMYGYGTISASYNMADIKLNLNSREVRIGGISGLQYGGEITNSYSFANISTDNDETYKSLFGGIVGSIGRSGTIINSYYLNTIQPVYGYTDGSAVMITNSFSKTESEMKSSGFVDLLNAGLDEPVWIIKDEINNGYPILSFQR